MRETVRPIEGQDLQELEEVTGLQVEAARRGDLSELQQLLRRRQSIFLGLQRGDGASARLARIRQLDTEARGLLETRILAVKKALQQLRSGARALRGYAAPGLVQPGFLDEHR
jgi:hypothetical protein